MELREVELSLAELNKIFPMVNPEIAVSFIYLKDGITIGIFIAEMIPGHAVMAHAFIPFKERNKENLELIRDGFYKFFHPWVKSQGKTEIVVTSDYNNKSAQTFQEMLGFTLAPIYIGGMPVKED